MLIKLTQPYTKPKKNAVDEADVETFERDYWVNPTYIVVMVWTEGRTWLNFRPGERDHPVMETPEEILALISPQH